MTLPLVLFPPLAPARSIPSEVTPAGTVHVLVPGVEVDNARVEELFSVILAPLPVPEIVVLAVVEPRPKSVLVV
jgi:hypothetical protein